MCPNVQKKYLLETQKNFQNITATCKLFMVVGLLEKQNEREDRQETLVVCYQQSTLSEHGSCRTRMALTFK